MHSILPALGDGLRHDETIFVPEYLDRSDDNQAQEENYKPVTLG